MSVAEIQRDRNRLAEENREMREAFRLINEITTGELPVTYRIKEIIRPFVPEDEWTCKD